MNMLSEPEMQQAVRRRDSRYDGRFLYGVVTTGIFCKPSCASPHALPEHLRFFPDPASAITAGFRPCKRCRPTNSQGRYERMVDGTIEAYEKVLEDRKASREVT